MTDVEAAPMPRMPEYPNVVPPVDEQWRAQHQLVENVLVRIDSEWCEVDACPSAICGGPHQAVETDFGTELVRVGQQPLGTPKTAVQRESTEGSLGRDLHEGSSPAPTTSAADAGRLLAQSSMSAVVAGEGSSQLVVPVLPASTFNRTQR